MNKTLRQMLRESWLPGLGGLGWMLWSAAFAYDPADRTWTKLLGALASGFIFFGFLTSQYLRISRQQRTENSLGDAANRLDAVASRMEEGVAAMTGGDSFCWVDVVDLNSPTADDLSAANIRANNGGRHTMYDVSALLRIGGHSLAPESTADATATGTQLPQFFDFQNVPVGNYRQVSGHRLRLTATPVLRVAITIFARNGTLEEALTLRNVGRKWLSACQVVRDGKRIHSQIDRGFPRKLDGSPDW